MPHNPRLAQQAATTYTCCNRPMAQDGPGRYHCERCQAFIDLGTG